MDVGRRILVLLTVVAATFGPQWCCCTFRAAPAASTTAAGGGCCCCEPDALPASCPVEQDGHERDRPCRCRESTQLAAVSIEQTWSGPDGSVIACPGWLAACRTARLPGCEPSGEPTDGGRWPRAGEIPTLSGRALLRALSTLRC